MQAFDVEAVFDRGAPQLIGGADRHAPLHAAPRQPHREAVAVVVAAGPLVILGGRLPPELAPTARVDLSDADRAFVTVLGRVVGPQRRRAWAEMLQDLPDDPVATEFDDLPEDADEATRQDIAERIVPYVRALRARHPNLAGAHSDAPHGERFAARTVATAIQDLYNPAQLDVMRRTGALLRAGPTEPPG